MKPSVSVWTTSLYVYDQRIQRIVIVLEAMGATVTIWDRKTENHPNGKIKPRMKRGPGFYLDYNRQIARLVCEHPADLIYAADIDVMPGLMWGLKNSEETPLLLDLHEWFPEVVELRNKPLKKRIWRWIEHRSVEFASARMTVNRSLKHIFEERYGRTFTVVRNVPERQPVHQMDTDKRLKNKILYYQGALNEGRGLNEAVEALHLLSGWRLWLVGEGDVLEEIKVKTEVEGLDDRVVFYGRKHPDELRDLASQATVGLNLLSGHSKSYYFSLANKYFDYIHAGLPAIHMDFPEYQTLMNEFTVGHLINVLSPAYLADVVNQITVDKYLYNSMIEQCDSAKTTYSWQEESKVLVELLNDWWSRD